MSTSMAIEQKGFYSSRRIAGKVFSAGVYCQCNTDIGQCVYKAIIYLECVISQLSTEYDLYLVNSD
jgi:hypothetical protein